MMNRQDGGDDSRTTSRRDFLKSATVAAGALTVGAASSPAIASEKTAGKTSGKSITISGYKFRRVEALAEGKVSVEGYDTTFETAAIGDMNNDVFSGPQSREVTEIGLHPFMLAYANEGFRDYQLLPIFPLRLFRHKSIFIRTDRGIEKPEDLKGKKIATPGYSSTSLTWIRGFMEDEYGISPRDVNWVLATEDSSAGDAGKVSKQESMLPDGLTFTRGPEGKDESDLLESGEVDALFHAAEPRAYLQGHPKVARLFEDFRSIERKYFAKTGIFPIMHAVAIKKTVLKRDPGLARAVFNAYSEAKKLSFEHMARLGWIFDSLPWYGQEFEETKAAMGDNYYSYGIEPNRKVLELLFKYSHQQGLSSRRLTIEELFAPESLEFSEA